MTKKRSVSNVLIGLAIGCLATSVTSWLFYDFEPLSVLLIIAAPGFIPLYLGKKKEEERIGLQIRFKDALFYMKTGLDAGESAEKSLNGTIIGLKGLYGEKALITREFVRMRAKISTGSSMEAMFSDFSQRTGSKEAGEFAELFKIIRRTGGSLNRVVSAKITEIQNKISLIHELNITIASKKGEFNIMCLVPYFILFYLKMFAKEMSAPLYHNSKGILFMSAMLLFYIGFYVIGRSIIKRTMNI